MWPSWLGEGFLQNSVHGPHGNSGGEKRYSSTVECTSAPLETAGRLIKLPTLQARAVDSTRLAVLKKGGGRGERAKKRQRRDRVGGGRRGRISNAGRDEQDRERSVWARSLGDWGSGKGGGSKGSWERNSNLISIRARPGARGVCPRRIEEE